MTAHRPHLATRPARSPSSFARADRTPARDQQNAKGRYERYLALARAEALSGDRVAAENYYQHAEHYLRAARA